MQPSPQQAQPSPQVDTADHPTEPLSADLEAQLTELAGDAVEYALDRALHVNVPEHASASSLLSRLLNALSAFFCKRRSNKNE